MDVCAISVNDDHALSMHSLSSCIKAYSQDTPNRCVDDSTCDQNNGAWKKAISVWSTTSDYGGVVGIARDGHPIYGPYNTDGELWVCDEHDVCNGTFLDNNSYVYVVTPTFPYVLGCYGPGATQYYPLETTCSTMSCGATEGVAVFALSLAAAISLVLL